MKNTLSRRAIALLVVVLAAFQSFTCDYTIVLSDSNEDGWSNNTITNTGEILTVARIFRIIDDEVMTSA